ncbi:MmgE/PrpD family protein [Rhizohabitans arisaemae]|uniref:MmgE/PrpD family protein n=1 Tax=Rhizohabitans arisaemae TaxID=2720610 RepID=UPI0024B11560|nr:MmgE/PrpD family protein [Rhizohabitans arisaemae]
MTQAPDVTDHLARSVPTYLYERIPADVVLIAKSSILDWLGVALAGAGEPVSQAIAGTAAPPATGPAATVLTRADGASPADAARINGTAGHVLDYDDVLTAFDGHPTAPVLPAALAVAEVRGASGRDLLAAFVAGVETQTRVNRAVTPSHYLNGFHTTASVGVFGAAAASAHLLRLGPRRTGHALGLAATAASGLKSAFGSWGKSLQVGRAAAEGLLAARLARRGAIGPVDGIGCAQGFAPTHADAVDLAEAMTAAGTPWYCREILYKFHASCYGTHSSVEALLRLRPRLPVDRIAGVELRVTPMHVGMCTRPYVRTPLDAKFSLEFTAAMALVLGQVGEDAFTPETLARDDLRRLAAVVRTEVDPDRPFTRTAVSVVLTDGTTLRDTVDVGVPAAAGRLEPQWDRLTGKFRSLAVPVVGSARAEEIVSRVAALDGLVSVARLTALLREPGPTSPTGPSGAQIRRWESHEP